MTIFQVFVPEIELWPVMHKTQVNESELCANSTLLCSVVIVCAALWCRRALKREHDFFYFVHKCISLYTVILITKTTWRLHVSSVCLSKQGTLYNPGRRSFSQSFIMCTQTNYIESPLSTLSSLSVFHVCLVVHVITGMHSMCLFLHG